jgi:segregation and condensation protein B
MKDYLQAIEAVLFVAGQPMSKGEIEELLEDHFPNLDVVESLQELKALYLEQRRPISVNKIAGGYVLQTLPEVAPYIAPLFEGKRKGFSRGALEVLSIIAFKQPITRREIDAIRGVESTAHVESLSEGEWIEIVGKKEVPGRPALLGTTKKFLLHFGLNSIGDLKELVHRKLDSVSS